MSDTAGNVKIKKVLLVTFNPRMPNGELFDMWGGYPDPSETIRNFMDTINTVSGGSYQYVIERSELIEECPRLEGDIIYPAQFLQDIALGKREPFEDKFDYADFVERFDIVRLISSRVIDEVWVQAPSICNMYGAVMGGPNPFWLDGPSIPDTWQSGRRFVIMGFDLLQDEGAMLESFIHRSEASMNRVYEKYPPHLNMWSKFVRDVGTAHRTPNSVRDYDWGNPAYVESACDDWYNYPLFTHKRLTVNKTTWGFGSRIQHHEWWLKHLPNRPGKHDGLFTNWWHYIMSPDWISSSGV